jgi:hypothetical protein
LIPHSPDEASFRFDFGSASAAKAIRAVGRGRNRSQNGNHLCAPSVIWTISNNVGKGIGGSEMHSILPKAARAALFAAGILLGGSVTDYATADVFRVQLSGTFTSAGESPPVIKPGTPFTGAFYVDTAAPGVVHEDFGGLR